MYLWRHNEQKIARLLQCDVLKHTYHKLNISSISLLGAHKTLYNVFFTTWCGVSQKGWVVVSNKNYSTGSFLWLMKRCGVRDKGDVLPDILNAWKYVAKLERPALIAVLVNISASPRCLVSTGIRYKP